MGRLDGRAGRPAGLRSLTDVEIEMPGTTRPCACNLHLARPQEVCRDAGRVQRRRLRLNRPLNDGRPALWAMAQVDQLGRSGGEWEGVRQVGSPQM